MPVGRNKVDLMQLGNLVAGNMQRKRERQQQAMQFQQQMQLRRKAVDTEQARYQAGQPLRELQAEAAQLTIDEMKTTTKERKTKKQLGKTITDFLTEEGITEFTSMEQAIETIPGLSQYGGQLPYVQELLAPYVKEKREIPLDMYFEFGVPFERLPEDWQAVPGLEEGWTQTLERKQKIEEMGLEQSVLGLEQLRLSVEDMRKLIENWEKVRLPRPTGGPGRYTSPYMGIDDKVIHGQEPTEEEWAGVGVTTDEQKASYRAAVLEDPFYKRGKGLGGEDGVSDSGQIVAQQKMWQQFSDQLIKDYDVGQIEAVKRKGEYATSKINRLENELQQDVEFAFTNGAPEWVHQQLSAIQAALVEARGGVYTQWQELQKRGFAPR